MLRQETVVPELIEVIREFQCNPLFKDFYLAGGTSLALQLGHRISTDIDLFSYNKYDFSKLNEYFKYNPEKYNTDVNQDNFIRIYKDGIKVEFVHDLYGKLIKHPLTENGITYLDKIEIAPMKLWANLGRKKVRDIIDIAFLLKEISLEKMFDLYKEKYGPFNVNILKRVLLTRSETVNNDEELINIKMLRNDIKLNDIPDIIKQAIDEYNSKVGIGKTMNKSKKNKI